MTQPNVDRLPPQNLEAEKSVLGCMLLDSDTTDDVLPILRAEDFFNDANAKLFAQMVKMVDEGIRIDPTLLMSRLRDDGEFEAMGGEAYLGEVAQSVAVAAHAKHYAEIVREQSTRRHLLLVGAKLLADGYDAQDTPAAILERAEAALSGIRMGTEETEPVTLYDATSEAITAIDAIQQRGLSSGVFTGLASFDTDQGGLFPGELIILAARPGIGKTSLALQVAYHVAAKGHLAYYASLEMSAVVLSTRLACSLSGVSSRLVRTGRITSQDAGKLNDAMTEQSQATLDIHDQPGLTVAEIRRQIRRRKKRGLTLAVIDYLQLLSVEDRRIPREQQVARITKSLKETAREYDIPILCLCQLNRLADGEENPQLSHLRESGAIEQDADVVLFLAPHKPTDLARNNASLIVAKNRNGETGPIPLDWHPSRTQFTCTEPICEDWTA